jgi:transposase-like protein
MSKQRKNYTPEERLSLVQEAQREGVTETSRKYNVASSLLHKWKQRYLNKGLEGLKPTYKRIDPEVRALEDENERLKKIIAKQALQIEVQGELLKKTPIGPSKKYRS